MAENIDILGILKSALRIPLESVYKIAKAIEDQIKPVDYIEIAKKYGTEEAPVPPPAILTMAALNPISQAVGFVEFITEEAMQMTSFGLMGLIRQREYDAADIVLDQLNRLWKYGMTLHETIGIFNPTSYASFGLNFKAVAAMILGYKYIIAKNTRPDIQAMYEKLDAWYNDAKDELNDQKQDELSKIKEAYDILKRDIYNKRSKELKAIMDMREKGEITYDEWLAKRSAIYDKYSKKLNEAYNAYDDLKDQIYDKYKERFTALRKEYDYKKSQLDIQVIGKLIEEDPEIFKSVQASYAEVSLKYPKVEIPIKPEELVPPSEEVTPEKPPAEEKPPIEKFVWKRERIYLGDSYTPEMEKELEAVAREYETVFAKREDIRNVRIEKREPEPGHIFWHIFYERRVSG